MSNPTKDPMIAYYETAEFVAYLAVYAQVLEAEAERITVYQDNGFIPVAFTVVPVCVEASDKQKKLWEESQRLLSLARATPEHVGAFGY